jgi:hypothetical protein
MLKLPGILSFLKHFLNVPYSVKQSNISFVEFGTNGKVEEYTRNLKVEEYTRNLKENPPKERFNLQNLSVDEIVI